MAKKVGRPSVYTEKLATTICARLAEGRSLRSICEDEKMPAASTVHLWVVENREGFSEQYARARQAQALRWADEILDIADDGSNDTYVTEKGEAVNYDHISRSKLRVDTRKWMLSRMMPKVFGDKTQVEHSGPEGGPIEVRDLSDAELAERARQLTNRVGAMVSGDGPSTNGKH